MRPEEELLDNIFKHYHYFVSWSRTDPPFLSAKKGDVRVAVGFFFGDREVVIYDLKRFLSVAQGGPLFTGFFFITNTRLEYHARRFARDNGIIAWERGKLVEELGKVQLAGLEKAVFGSEEPWTPAAGSQASPPAARTKTHPQGAQAPEEVPDPEPVELSRSPRELFTREQGEKEEDPGEVEPKNFTDKLRVMFNKENYAAPREGEENSSLKESLTKEASGETRTTAPAFVANPKPMERFVDPVISAKELEGRFLREKVLDVALQYVPYFCFDYRCQLFDQDGGDAGTTQGRIAVNGLTADCEEWGGEMETSPKGKEEGLKVTPAFRPRELTTQVKEAIISTNTIKEDSLRGSHWTAPKGDDISFVYQGIIYFPFYNLALPDRNHIIDGTTGEEE